MDLFASGESRWLGVQANLPGEVEQPRALLVSVPYALKAADAETLGGKPLAAFVLTDGANNAGDQNGLSSAGNGTKAKKLPLNTAALSGTGTTNTVVKWTAGQNGVLGDSLLFDNGTNVGIGTSTPSSKLSVYNLQNSGNTAAILAETETASDAYTNSTIIGVDAFVHNRGVSLPSNLTGSSVYGVRSIVDAFWTAGPGATVYGLYAKGKVEDWQMINTYYGLYLDTAY